jgi:hypothetical protein
LIFIRNKWYFIVAFLATFFDNSDSVFANSDKIAPELHHMATKPGNVISRKLGFDERVISHDPPSL